MTVPPLASAGITKALRDLQLALRALETDGAELHAQRQVQGGARKANSYQSHYQ